MVLHQIWRQARTKFGRFALSFGPKYLEMYSMLVANFITIGLVENAQIV